MEGAEDPVRITPPISGDLSGYGLRSAEVDKIGWDGATGRAEVAGTILNYVELGDRANPSLVLIHGLSGSWLNWKVVIPLLARDHHVVALDLPGFGSSPLPAEPISMRRYAGLVEALCESLGLGQVAVVANSMGGYVAVEWAAEHPDRVNSLVLSSAAGISTASIDAERMISRARQLAKASRMVPLLVRRMLMHRADWRKRVLAVYVAHADLLDARTANELAAGLGTPGYPGAVRALAERNIHDQAKRVRCPVLIVWGDQDRIIPVKHAERFAALIPGAKVEIFHDTGHMQMIERPLAFTELVGGFISGRP